jgi:hypothetical protein
VKLVNRCREAVKLYSCCHRTAGEEPATVCRSALFADRQRWGGRMNLCTPDPRNVQHMECCNNWNALYSSCEADVAAIIFGHFGIYRHFALIRAPMAAERLGCPHLQHLGTHRAVLSPWEMDQLT